MNNSSDLFPFQVSILNYILESIKKGEKRILIVAPPGVGKSRILIETISTLLVKPEKRSIGLIFPGIMIGNQYFNRLKYVLIENGNKYEINRKSLLIFNNKFPSLSSEPSLYFVDETLDSKVKSILQNEDN